jgi:hypothetical protein
MTYPTTTSTPYIPDSDCSEMCHNHTKDCTCSFCFVNQIFLNTFLFHHFKLTFFNSKLLQNCQDNTEGDRCQYCKPGYVGNATRGTPYDCVRGREKSSHNVFIFKISFLI